MNEENEIVFFKGDDPEMSKAAKTAQETFRWFWYQISSDFNRIVPAISFSMIKAAFSNDFNNPDETVEHMFVDDIRYDGRQIKGVLRSDPNWVQSLTDGDEVTLTLDRVGDWLCVIGDIVYGGFAIQVIRSNMSVQERAAHDDAWGLPFPDIGTVHIPERSLEFEKTIARHLKNALAENPKIIATNDINHRTPLHNEALFGRIETTKTLLEHGADTNAKCDHGWTALDYANALEWKEVAQLLKTT